jgi:hypothetical protein
MSQFAKIRPVKFLCYALAQRHPNAQHSDSTGSQRDSRGKNRRGSGNTKTALNVQVFVAMATVWGLWRIFD